MNETLNTYLLIAVFAVAAVILAVVTTKPPAIFGTAVAGTYATAASSSVVSVAANTVTTVIGTTTCASRIITVQAVTNLTFGDAFTPTLNNGHVQAASTTVSYDGSQYGCGKVKALSASGESIIFTDTR